MSTADTGSAGRRAPSRDEDTSPHTPALIVAPAVDTQYRADDTLGETHAKTLQARTLAQLATYADGYDIPVLVTRNERNEFTEPVATVADHHLKCKQTRMAHGSSAMTSRRSSIPSTTARTTRRLRVLAAAARGTCHPGRRGTDDAGAVDADFKIRGIEARQRSTPPFIEDVQRDCLDRLDATRSPDVGARTSRTSNRRMQAGNVAVERIVERNRVSKPLEAYSQNNQNVAALKRAREQDLAVHPGQDIEYVVVDDEKSSRDRVALAHEAIETYDASYYETQLVRAVESVLAPLGGTDPTFAENSPVRGTPF